MTAIQVRLSPPLVLVAVPMVLHGVYDTLLKKDYPGLALLTALASFGWLAWQIEAIWGLYGDLEERSRADLAAAARSQK